jgi:hypothetical protein
MNYSKLDTKITDGRVEYESLDEFQKQKGNYPREIRIEGETSSPYSSVVLALSKSEWRLAGLSADNRRLVYDIEHIVRRRQTVLAYFSHYWLTAVELILAVIGIWFIPSWVSRVYLWTGSAPIFSGLALDVYPLLRTGVVLRHKHEAGFISRNRDKIIVAVGTALFLAALQILIWLLTGKDIKLFGP